MGTVAEIERAIQKLSSEELAELRLWLESHGRASNPQPVTVDWSRSAAVTRERNPQECIPATAVLSVLRDARE